MKRISPDITDEAWETLEHLRVNRKQTMGALISELILRAEEHDLMALQMGQHLAAIHKRLEQICGVLLEKEVVAPPAPVQSATERYGADWIRPVAPLQKPQKTSWWKRK